MENTNKELTDLFQNLVKSENADPFESDHAKAKRFLEDTYKDQVHFGHRPHYVYKFQKLDEYTIRNMRNNSLYFNSPISYNDPFDCSLDIDIDLLRSEMQQVIINSIDSSKNSEQLSNMQKLLNDESHMNRITSNAFYSNFLYINSICCFSLEKKNILMWAHYADNHKGICLEFDTKEDPSLFSQGDYVRYVSEYPKLTLENNNQDFIARSLLFTKSDHWSYEKEYRIRQLFTEDEANRRYVLGLESTGKKLGLQVTFRPESLKRVFFGCALSDFTVSDEKIEKARELSRIINSFNSKTLFSFSHVSDRDFSLTFDEDLSYDELISHLDNLSRYKEQEKKYQKDAVRLFSGENPYPFINLKKTINSQ